jgi:hypothetical protein
MLQFSHTAFSDVRALFLMTVCPIHCYRHCPRCRICATVLIDALLRGASDGMDILTLSLGSGNGWTESMSSVVASRLADMGKIITIATGNDGASGSWFPGAPADGIDVIS